MTNLRTMIKIVKEYQTKIDEMDKKLNALEDLLNWINLEQFGFSDERLLDAEIIEENYDGY